MYANMCAKTHGTHTKMHATGARVAARGYWPAHRLQARVI